MIRVNQKLLSVMRRAITDYNMIQDGDRVAVGLSGGKDSLMTLAALANYRLFSPQKFELVAITVDLGFKDADFSPLIDFCQKLDVKYHIEKTDIYNIIFEHRKKTNPCSLCSKMRRGTLNTIMINKGYNKLALGHHGDDLIETLLLSLFYEGRLSTFAPIGYMDRTGISLIRPLIYADEKNIAAATKDYPVLFNPCPANHYTKREYMKDLVKKLQKDIPGVKERMLRAIINPERNNLWDKITPFKDKE